LRQQTTASNGAFEGLSQKIAEITRFYEDSLSHPDVRALAEALAYDDHGSVDVVGFFNHLKSLVRYLPDPTGVEFIKAPWAMVKEIQTVGSATGDCDDFAALAYTLLHSVGVEAELYVGWYDNAANPSHIFVGIPEKSGAYRAFDLVANAYGQTKAGLTGVKSYA